MVEISFKYVVTLSDYSSFPITCSDFRIFVLVLLNFIYFFVNNDRNLDEDDSCLRKGVAWLTRRMIFDAWKEGNVTGRAFLGGSDRNWLNSTFLLLSLSTYNCNLCR